MQPAFDPRSHTISNHWTMFSLHAPMPDLFRWMYVMLIMMDIPHDLKSQHITHPFTNATRPNWHMNRRVLRYHHSCEAS